MTVDAPTLKALHDERSKQGTQRVDCWACEAGRSQVIAGLVERVDKAEAALSHTNAVLNRAVPDEDNRKALWREHWGRQLAVLTGDTVGRGPA